MDGEAVDNKIMLVHMEELAQKLGIGVRYEKMPEEVAFSAGGLCRIRGELTIIINGHASDGEKVRTLARALKRFNLSEIYLKPAIREFLDNLPEDE